MTDKRVPKFVSIGFQWSLRSQTKPHSWDCRFQELQLYKAEYGHCNVPLKSGILRWWVDTQRTQYWLSKEGTTSSMTDECVQKLESIGFQRSPRSQTKPHSWDCRFQELQLYKDDHGHCKVPLKSGTIWLTSVCENLRQSVFSGLSNQKKVLFMGLQVSGTSVIQGRTWTLQSALKVTWTMGKYAAISVLVFKRRENFIHDW